MCTSLDREDVAARIKAARLLRGMSQDELARKMADAGLPFRLVGALERCEADMRLAHRGALAQALGFPERWFTAALEDICPPEEAAREQRDRMEQQLARIEALLRKD